MKHKVIVTGGCGYIGSHTVIALIQNNFKVIILDDLSNSNEQTIERIYQITNTRPELIIVDLKNNLETKKIFKTHKDSVGVIHFAAHKAVGESVEKPLEYYQNNLYSLLNVLEAQDLFKIKTFIFSSSATVYGLPKKLPITERNETQRPFSPYGNTKKIAEEILDDFTKANTDFSAISLRYFNPIGAHESGLIGELPNGIPNNLMPYITQTAIGLRKKLMVFGNDYPTKDGTAIRDYLHVEDLATAHVIAIKRLLRKENKTAFEFFNLGTGNGYSVLDVINAFEKVSKTKLNYEITNRREGDVPELYAEVENANKILGWSAVKDLEQMVSSSWKWEKNVRKIK